MESKRKNKSRFLEIANEVADFINSRQILDTWLARIHVPKMVKDPLLPFRLGFNA
jgi:hypothetical protein